MTEHSPNQCHDCGSNDLISFEEYKTLPRVTSDCKPWAAAGSLLLCERCGLLQAAMDMTWKEEVRRIYASYDCHYQSGGIDQSVYDLVTGAPTKRAEKLLRELTRRELLPSGGLMVDIGCGSGGFLKAFASVLPHWRLAGLEQAAKYEADIRAIPGMVAFFPTPLDQLEGEYSLVTLIHVFEHIPQPCATLQRLGTHLQPEGVFFIEVPDYEENPFELVVADHASHFSRSQLLRVVERAGSRRKHQDLNWLPKELSLVATKPREPIADYPSPETTLATVAQIRSQIHWLKSVANQASDHSRQQPFGVFGTSIAATWLVGVVGEDAIEFFVDEDPSRIGLQHFGKPILAPHEVSADSTVFVPLAPTVAEAVRKRLSPAPFALVIPDSAHFAPRQTPYPQL
jgi:hypothetical protein